jgi:hypothetical protein
MNVYNTYRGGAVRALVLAALAAGALATSALAAPGAAPGCFGESGFDVIGHPGRRRPRRDSRRRRRR